MVETKRFPKKMSDKNLAASKHNFSNGRELIRSCNLHWIFYRLQFILISCQEAQVLKKYFTFFRVLCQ